MNWARNRWLTVAYVAALNPFDRNKAVITKLSLAGALLAAGRNGLVAPLSYEGRWKVPFSGMEMHGELPAGLPKSEGTPKAGRIVFAEREHSFILTGNPDDRDLKISCGFARSSAIPPFPCVCQADRVRRLRAVSSLVTG